jgi:hypothetical protein
MASSISSKMATAISAAALGRSGVPAKMKTAISSKIEAAISSKTAAAISTKTATAVPPAGHGRRSPRQPGGREARSGPNTGRSLDRGQPCKWRKTAEKLGPIMRIGLSPKTGDPYKSLKTGRKIPESNTTETRTQLRADRLRKIGRNRSEVRTSPFPELTLELAALRPVLGLFLGIFRGFWPLFRSRNRIFAG